MSDRQLADVGEEKRVWEGENCGRVWEGKNEKEGFDEKQRGGVWEREANERGGIGR